MKRLSIFSLNGMAIFPLLNFGTSNLVVLVFVLYSIIKWKIHRQKQSVIGFRKIAHIIALSLPFVLFSFSIFWSEYSDNGYSFIERSLLFIIIPIVVFVFRPFENVQQIKTFQKVYVVSTFLLALFTLLYLMYALCLDKITYDISDYKSILFLRTEIGKIPFLKEHPIYFTLILGVGIILLAYNNFSIKWLKPIFFLIMFIMVLLASSRGPILSMVLVLAGMIIYRLKKPSKYIPLVLVFLSITCLVFYYTPMKSRVLEMVNTKKIYPEGVHHNSFNLRMGIYKCGLEIAKETPFFGYGSGSVQPKLDSCYKSNFNTSVYEQNIYNSHNQYLFYFICFGYFGLTLILASYVFFLMKAYKARLPEYLFFLLFLFLSLITENALNRNTGIMIFSIFNTLLFFQTELDDNNKR